MSTTGRALWMTLVAMTLANSMILVDQTAVPLATPDVIRDLNADVDLGQWLLTANILPLAALMVLGGRIGDLIGLRRVFIGGSVIFCIATGLAGAAQSIEWMIGVRALQGVGAALMMPTAMAIVSAVFPVERRGTALGILAGASAFFAALGPVLGGALTSIDWRLVFWINVPLALLAIILTAVFTPKLATGATRPRLDYIGVVTFAVAIGALVYGLSQGQPNGWGSPETLVPLGASIVAFVVFVIVEQRVAEPLINFRLLRHLNFLAANISQVLAGMIELGLGYLMPFFLLLVIGLDPAVAGIALIPGTLPVIAAGPLAGRFFDRVGGRLPLVVGFLILAASGAALAVGATDASVGALIPGLALQGLGLGIVLTVNDPTGLTAVPDSDAGQAAGMINTAEQMGGAIGIAALTAVEVGYYMHVLGDRLADRGITPTKDQYDTVRDFILEAEQRGLSQVREEGVVRVVVDDLVQSHIDSFQLTFVAAGVIALVGALACLVLVRRTTRIAEGPIFGRRSRWILANVPRTPGLTRRPPLDAPAQLRAPAKEGEGPGGAGGEPDQSSG